MGRGASAQWRGITGVISTLILQAQEVHTVPCSVMTKL
jgi:hypothetical protein